MLRFLLVRILQAIPVLVVMSVITFAIIQAPPGDYGDMIKSNMVTQGGSSIAAAEAAAQEFREREGLIDPFAVQYVRWIGGIVTRGDFGHSSFYNRPVSEVVAERLPRTIMLALTCHVLASLLGIRFGILAATRQYSWLDTALSFVAFLGMTLLRKLQREKGLSYLFISHDLKVVRALCHRVMVMQQGRIVEEGPVDEVLVNPKTDYTKRLVRAAFEIAASLRKGFP